MCGIQAYSCSSKNNINAVDVCLRGLELLEYRGYDSSGIAGIVQGKIRSCKRVGTVNVLKSALAYESFRATTAIAHTRWATHGVPNEVNAHPQFDEHHTLAVVHNGIIDNYLHVRRNLEKQGVSFHSDTDSEVIAQLIAHYYQGCLRTAITRAIKELSGMFAIAVIHVDHPNEIIAVAQESPLALAVNREGTACYLSSDPHSFIDSSLQISYLQNGEIAILKRGKIHLYNLEGKKLTKESQLLEIVPSSISKNGFDHFMLKEIFEQPRTLYNGFHRKIDFLTKEVALPGLKLSSKEAASIERIFVVGCGSAWHAGYFASLVIEQIARIPTIVKIASEFRYSTPVISSKTLILAISQSGETADTLAACRKAKQEGAKVIAMVNVPYSSLHREADSTIFLEAGPEISVCSTKAFTNQLLLSLLFSLQLKQLLGKMNQEEQQLLAEVALLPEQIEQVLSQAEIIESLAKTHSLFSHFFFLGRGYMYPTALEAALKLQEISYLPSTGLPAGEMKHGPLAAISPNLATIGLCGHSLTFDKMISNLMEVQARGGKILAFAPKGKEQILSVTSDVIWLPHTSDFLSPILYSIAGQLFAYYIAKLQKTDIDKPRHLAKSVTVE